MDVNFYTIYLIFKLEMSFSKTLDMFRDKARVVINDMYIGDEGAHELAAFLRDHTRVQSLEIKSNNISSAGFIQIFSALEKNTGIKQIIAEYNEMGANDYQQWYDSLGSLISRSPKLQRLNISNNKITSEGFSHLIYPLCESKSLKLLQIRYNAINSDQISKLSAQLKNSQNSTLLFVETAGNKINKQVLQTMEAILKNNRKNNPISKDKLLMTGGFYDKVQPSHSQSNFNRTNAIDDLSKENVLRHLETILDQNRKDTAEMKVRLENQLVELQRREKLDGKQLNELDAKCNQLIIQNRNLKYELDRTVSEHQQMERDQELHLRVHEQKLREANKQLQQLQNKYEELESRMNKEHQLKMKQIARDWEGRLRSVEQKIRASENQNSIMQNQIRKHMEKRQRLKMQYVEEENVVRNRVEQEQNQRYNFRLSALESRLQQVQQSREKYLHRNQDIVYELQKCQTDNNREISILQDQLGQLRHKQEEFVAKNKDFINRNQRLKNDIQMKELNIQKLEEQINRFNEEIELKKAYNREQIDKIITDNEYDRSRREEQKNSQIHKMTELETILRNSQLENAKLRQQYAILAQKLQISLGKAVQDVFSENNLY